MIWRGMTTPQRSGAPVETDPLSLVIYPTNRKSTVGQYRGRGPGPERCRTVEQLKEVRLLYEKPKEVAVVDIH